MRLSLFCGVALALQTAPLQSLAGSFNSASQITSISTDADDGSCSDTGSSYYYQLVNYTFASAGVRAINTYEVDFLAVIRNGSTSNLTSLCDHGAFPLKRGDYASGYSYLYPYGGWFDANVTYTFIVGGSNQNDKYVAEIWDGIQGQTAPNRGQNQTNQTFSPLTLSSSGYCYQADPSLYDTQVVSINTTGTYNVFLAFAQNTAINRQVPYGSPSFSVFTGDVSGMNLSDTNCSSTNFIGGDSGDSGTLNVQNFSLWLYGNQTYTFVVTAGYLSSDTTYYGHYSLTISPAQRSKFSTILTFNRPTYSSSSCAATGATCTTASSYSASSYAISTFQVPAGSSFYLHATENQDANGLDASRDLAFFLYSGGNTFALACGPVGTTCFDAEDTMNGDIYTSSASEWTLIAVPWSNSASWGHDASMDVYVVGAQFTQASAPTTPTSPPSAMTPSAMTPSSPPSSRAPTPVGYTYAPTAPTTKVNTTIAPTVVGYTYAPTATAPTVVNTGAMFHPGLVTVAVLSGLFWL